MSTRAREPYSEDALLWANKIAHLTSISPTPKPPEVVPSLSWEDLSTKSLPPLPHSYSLSGVQQKPNEATPLQHLGDVPHKEREQNFEPGPKDNNGNDTGFIDHIVIVLDGQDGLTEISKFLTNYAHKTDKYLALRCIVKKGWVLYLKYSGSNKVYTVPLSSYRLTPEWAQLETATFERDEYQCRLCNKPGREGGTGLTAHHRTYENFGNETIDDLTTLCHNCHELFHKERELY